MFTSGIVALTVYSSLIGGWMYVLGFVVFLLLFNFRATAYAIMNPESCCDNVITTCDNTCDNVFASIRSSCNNLRLPILIMAIGFVILINIFDLLTGFWFIGTCVAYYLLRYLWEICTWICGHKFEDPTKYKKGNIVMIIVFFAELCILEYIKTVNIQAEEN